MRRAFPGVPPVIVTGLLPHAFGSDWYVLAPSGDNVDNS